MKKILFETSKSAAVFDEYFSEVFRMGIMPLLDMDIRFLDSVHGMTLRMLWRQYKETKANRELLASQVGASGRVVNLLDDIAQQEHRAFNTALEELIGLRMSNSPWLAEVAFDEECFVERIGLVFNKTTVFFLKTQFGRIRMGVYGTAHTCAHFESLWLSFV